MIKRYQFSWAMFIGAALSLGQPVWAEDDKPAAAPSPEQIFKELDKNSDGKLTADEVGEDRKRFFERLVRVGDQNDDGKLNAEEFQKASKSDDRPVEAGRGEAGREGRDRPDFEQRFKQLDRNSDGKITRDEVPDLAKPFINPLFERFGKDEITKEEFLKARGPQGQGRPGGESGLPGGGNPEEFFKRLDTNNDGKLTLDEVPDRGRPFVERLLKAAGKGNDAAISKDEFMAAVARIQGAVRGENANRGRPEGERRDGDRKPEGDRRPEGERRDGDRKPESDRKPEGERRDGDRKPEGAPRDGDRERKPGDDRDRKPEGAPRDGDGERKPDGERNRGDGERRPEGAPRDGERRPEGGPRDGGRGPDGAGRRPVPRFFEKLDANHDGRISADEFAKAKDLFKELDENGDGHLDPRELLGPPPGGRDGEMREGGDRPAPGRPPFGDRPAGRGGDAAPRDGRPGEGRRDEAAKREAGGREAGGRDAGSRRGREGLIKLFDKNGDGKISLEEAPERLKENFGRLDANGDGQLEAKEFPEEGPGAEGRGRRPEGDRPAKPEGRERPEGDKPRE